LVDAKESESVNQRSTDNTMTNRKRTNGQIMIYKTLHRKLKIKETRTPLTIGGELTKDGQFLLHK
jgi:hypothetical protein